MLWPCRSQAYIALAFNATRSVMLTITLDSCVQYARARQGRVATWVLCTMATSAISPTVQPLKAAWTSPTVHSKGELIRSCFETTILRLRSFYIDESWLQVDRCSLSHNLVSWCQSLNCSNVNDTIRCTILTCAQKLANSQLNLPWSAFKILCGIDFLCEAKS